MTEEQLAALEHVRAIFPSRWKAVIRQAWTTGDYSTIPGGPDQLDSTLQWLRNARGPSWLTSLKLN